MLFDVDFGYVLRTTATELILSRTQDELHYFYNNNISKKPEAHCCSESKKMPASISNKKIGNEQE